MLLAFLKDIIYYKTLKFIKCKIYNEVNLLNCEKNYSAKIGVLKERNSI